MLGVKLKRRPLATTTHPMTTIAGANAITRKVRLLFLACVPLANAATASKASASESNSTSTA
jgi:hypothetical protein